MKELIGKTIIKLEIGSDDTTLVFTDSLGNQYFYNSYGDCCSSTWFSHITGIHNFLGHEVNNTVEKEERDPTETEYKEGQYDVLRIYGYTLETDKGRCDVEFRNDSNGYYGGSCDFGGSKGNTEGYREVKEDF